MTPASRPRRIATRAAAGAVAALLLAAGGGCHAVPVGQVAPAPNRPRSTLGRMGRAALLPATMALDVPAETGAIDPSNSARGTVTPASAIGSEPRADLIATEAAGPRPQADEVAGRPTPLLDDALTRARLRGEVPDPAPVVLADLPPPATLLPAVAVGPAPSLAAEPSPLTLPEPVAAAPTPAAAVAADPAPPVAPEDAWRDGVRRLVGLARARQDQGEAGTGPNPWGLRARVLAWLAEPDIDPDLGQRDADAVRAVLRTLRAVDLGDATPRGDEVRVAVQALEAKAPLELMALQLCSQVDGFGDVTPFDPPSRRAGEWAILYCEVDGVHHEPAPGGFQTRVVGSLEIIPEGGGPAVVRPLGTAAEVFPRRRRDYYINFKIRLPTDLPPGPYTVRVTLRDVATERSATRSTPLTIVPGREPATESAREPSPAP